MNMRHAPIRSSRVYNGLMVLAALAAACMVPRVGLAATAALDAKTISDASGATTTTAVTGLHNHMMGERPAFYFTHFWGTGKAGDLARAFRAALDAQAAAKKS